MSEIYIGLYYTMESSNDVDYQEKYRKYKSKYLAEAKRQQSQEPVGGRIFAKNCMTNKDCEPGEICVRDGNSGGLSIRGIQISGKCRKQTQCVIS